LHSGALVFAMETLAIFKRMNFLEGEWEGKPEGEAGYSDRLVCIVENGVIEGRSELKYGDTSVHREFRIWVDGGEILSEWKIDDEPVGRYVCEYESEKDEFLFIPIENPNTYDFRTIRRISQMRFITMEQMGIEGTSSVRTFQMNYSRTL